MQSAFSLTAERRLCALFKTFGPNLKEYGRDLRDKYLTGHGGDPLQAILGGVGAAASAVLEGPDTLWAGMVDQEYTRPSGIAGRTRRDIGMLLKDVVSLRPIKAAGDAWRLAFSDVPLDIYDGVAGFHQSA